MRSDFSKPPVILCQSHFQLRCCCLGLVLCDVCAVVRAIHEGCDVQGVVVCCVEWCAVYCCFVRCACWTQCCVLGARSVRGVNMSTVTK